MIIFVLLSCTNPFAPKLADSKLGSSIIADQRQINGIFENMRYAYKFKDTVVYGNLLQDTFSFTHFNYDKGVDESWGRDEDMKSTNRMFQTTESLDLIWNNVIISFGDSLLLDINRGFTLTVTFNPEDIIVAQGKANFRIGRQKTSDDWKIITWRDVSDN